MTNGTNMKILNSSSSSTNVVVGSSGTLVANYYPEVVFGESTFIIPISGNITTSQINGITFAGDNTSRSFVLSFNVTGSGAVNFTVPKTLVSSGLIPTVYAGKFADAEQSYTEDSKNYYVFFSAFNASSIKIDFSAPKVTASTKSTTSTTTSTFTTTSLTSSSNSAIVSATTSLSSLPANSTTTATSQSATFPSQKPSAPSNNGFPIPMIEVVALVAVLVAIISAAFAFQRSRK